MKVLACVNEGTMFALALALGFATVYASVTNCGPKSVFQITELVLDPPNTVVAGQNVSLRLLYTSPVQVDSGTITTSVTYNFIPLTPTFAPLCEFTPCPIGMGSHDGSSWFVLPTGVKGTITTKIVWTELAPQMEQQELLCVSITMKASWY
jgi:hypothetical protein